MNFGRSLQFFGWYLVNQQVNITASFYTLPFKYSYAINVPTNLRNNAHRDMVANVRLNTSKRSKGFTHYLNDKTDSTFRVKALRRESVVNYNATQVCC
jgi:hypothetical protein